jgi:hypothetical protein
MTFRQWMAARQLLTEEFFGVLIRQQRQAEDDEFTRARKRIKP